MTDKSQTTNPLDKIITVAFPSRLKPSKPSIAYYAILCNRTPEEIEAFANAHDNQKCFVFPFFTKTFDTLPDCSDLWHVRVFMPCYVGHFYQKAEGIKQIVAQYCVHPEWASNEWAPIEWICIYDETPEGESDV